MEDLIAQFTMLSNHALCDRSFDPAAIKDLMKLFDVKSYKTLAAMDLSCSHELHEAQNTVAEAEDHLESAMESATEEFWLFKEEMDRMAATELSSLVQIDEASRKLGNTMEMAAIVASDKYVGAAMSSAVASMRFDWNN